MKLIIDIPDEIYNKSSNNRIKTTDVIYLVGVLHAVHCGTPLKEWLSSFNTDSAPICFNKIQELKRGCERDECTTKS